MSAEGSREGGEKSRLQLFPSVVNVMCSLVLKVAVLQRKALVIPQKLYIGVGS